MWQNIEDKDTEKDEELDLETEEPSEEMNDEGDVDSEPARIPWVAAKQASRAATPKGRRGTEEFAPVREATNDASMLPPAPPPPSDGQQWFDVAEFPNRADGDKRCVEIH